jgi:hypothetical protein
MREKMVTLRIKRKMYIFMTSFLVFKKETLDNKEEEDKEDKEENISLIAKNLL